MIDNLNPGGGCPTVIFQRQTLFQLVTDLCPTEAHFSPQAQASSQGPNPERADQPGATYPHQQYDPAAVRIDQLHDQCRPNQDGQQECSEMDTGVLKQIVHETAVPLVLERESRAGTQGS